jgi:hypothetical protein
MSKWRKHVTQSVHHVEAPREDQQIVQAVGSRGSNLIEVCQHQKPPLMRALSSLSFTLTTLPSAPLMPSSYWLCADCSSHVLV